LAQTNATVSFVKTFQESHKKSGKKAKTFQKELFHCLKKIVEKINEGHVLQMIESMIKKKWQLGYYY